MQSKPAGRTGCRKPSLSMSRLSKHAGLFGRSAESIGRAYGAGRAAPPSGREAETT